MGKAPAFQFYPGDWFREPGLKRVDLRVRGAWAEMLMIMWDENPQGHMETHIKGYAQTLRIEIPEACFIIAELESNKIANVEFMDEDCQKLIHEYSDHFQGLSPECPDLSQFCHVYVSITNRRMYRDWKAKEYERLKKQRQREKDASPPGVPKKSPPPSSSSSSSSLKKQPLAGVKPPGKVDIEESSITKIKEDIKKTCDLLYKSKKFPEVHKWANQALKCAKHPRSVLHVLARLVVAQDIKEPWAYCQKIIEVESGNYYEKGHGKSN